MTKKIDRRMKQFVVIGLGRFGKSVAKTLAGLGNEVLAIDINSEYVKQIEKYVRSTKLTRQDRRERNIKRHRPRD